MSRAGVLRALACLALAGFVLVPLAQAVVLSFTVTVPVEGPGGGEHRL